MNNKNIFVHLKCRVSAGFPRPVVRRKISSDGIQLIHVQQASSQQLSNYEESLRPHVVAIAGRASPQLTAWLSFFAFFISRLHGKVHWNHRICTQQLFYTRPTIQAYFPDLRDYPCWFLGVGDFDTPRLARGGFGRCRQWSWKCRKAATLVPDFQTPIKLSHYFAL